MSEAKEFMALCSKHELPCRDEEVMEMFFVNPGQDASPEARLAMALCRTCPIFFACRAEGLRIMDRWGIYGALTPADRERMAQGKESTA